jgi:predicted nucleic acid-binding protein
VKELLRAAVFGEVVVHASFASLTEVQYILSNEKGADAAWQTVGDILHLRLTWHHTDIALCASAAELKSAHKVSFADAFIAASTLRVNAVLVHKDPEFAPLAGQLKQEMLPPKNSPASTT